jgi:hypothetical protein
LGDQGFLPIVSILLDVFVCDEAYASDGSPELTDSFLSRDCHANCWTDEHIYYVWFAIVGLIMYVPLAVYARPLWQDYKVALHIKILPLMLMLKTVVQMMFIILNKTIFRSNILAHGVLYLIFLLGYILFNVKVVTFNYKRVWFWHLLSLFGVCWIAVLATMDTMIEDHDAFVYLLFAGWGVIMLFGLFFQRKRYPSMLFRPKPKDSHIVFSFGFGKTDESIAAQISHQSSLKLLREHSLSITIKKKTSCI